MYRFLNILFFFSVLYAHSQNEQKKNFAYKNSQLTKVLSDIENDFEVKFSYLDEYIKNKTIDIKKADYSLQEILQLLAEKSVLEFKKIDDRYYVILFREKSGSILNPKKIELLDEVVVNAYLAKGISKNADNSFTIIPQKLDVLPGLTEPDVLQTIQQLPGVISPNETATGLHVRGGTTDQNLILWDGIHMYQNGHLFGMISGFNPNIKQKINFINKGTNPRYGGRVSSVIDIQTDSKIPKKTEVAVGFNALSVDIYAKAPLLKNKASIQVSGRRAFTDYFQSKTFNEYSRKVFQRTRREINESREIESEQIEDKENSFYYQDYNAKIDYKISKKDHFYISGILIDNDLNNIQKNKMEGNSITDQLKIVTKGFSTRWQRNWNENFSHSMNSFYSHYKYTFLNQNYTNSDEYTIYKKGNLILNSGFDFEMDYKIKPAMHINVGYQLSANQVKHAFQSNIQNLEFVLDARDSFVQTHSFFTTYKYSGDNFFNTLIGFRYNYYAGLKDMVFEPRVQINLNLSKNIRASFTGEVKNQIVSQVRESAISDYGLENQIWIVSDTDDFPIVNAKQATTGFIYNKDRWTVDIDGYYKHTRGLTTLTLGFFNVSDPNFHKGESFSKGLDFYIKKDLKNFKIWGTYSYNDTQNKFEELNDDALFPSNSEVKHAVNTSFSYHINKFHIALGWFWRTGKPYTIADLLTNDDNENFIKYQGINTGRLDDYHRLDISSVFNFNLSNKNNIKAKTGFSIYNLYNRDNILNREYYSSNSLDGTLEVIDRHALKLTPNVFFRVYF